MIPKRTTLRVARPTDNLDEITQQYIDAMGFKELSNFEDHDGFNGRIIGHSRYPYHLEFTHHIGTKVGRAPTEDHLLVFYIPDPDTWKQCCESMIRAGFESVCSYNPYWDKNGATFQDIDGYRVVLQNE